MKLITFNEEYELLEFNYHIDNSYDSPISILELLIKTTEDNHLESKLNDFFIVETEKYNYVFSNLWFDIFHFIEKLRQT